MLLERAHRIICLLFVMLTLIALACGRSAPATPTARLPDNAGAVETAAAVSTAFAAATAFASTNVLATASPVLTASATLTQAATPTGTHTPQPTSAAQSIPFAYGWNVAFYAAYQPAANVGQYTPTSFNWIRITGEPEKAEYLCNQFRLPHKVLLRLNRARSGVSSQDVGADAANWAANLHTHNGSEKCVEAFEVGSAPNLSGGGEYGGPVNPEAYAEQLCAAYAAIKSIDSSYIVVSAGLAPTGGETADYLDEEKFARRMLTKIELLRGRADACFDAFGYQNYGFRAGYATDPGDEANCPSGLCFRGVERVQAVLVEYSVRWPIWSTGFGWIRDFASGGCGGASWAGSYNGAQVSDQAQADNLVGAFQFARANWPWLGAMFVANLDYNDRPWTPDPCVDPDGWFAVRGYPAESALEAMAKP